MAHQLDIIDAKVSIATDVRNTGRRLQRTQGGSSQPRQFDSLSCHAFQLQPSLTITFQAVT